MSAQQLPPAGAPPEAIAAAGQALADAVAWRDSLSPEDAALAAGARTPEQVSRVAGMIRGLRSAAAA